MQRQKGRGCIGKKAETVKDHHGFLQYFPEFLNDEFTQHIRLIFQKSLIYQQIKTPTAYFDKWTVSFYCSSVVFQNNPADRSVILHIFTVSVTNKNMSIYLVASMRCCFSQRNVLVLGPVTFSLMVEVNLKRMGGKSFKEGIQNRMRE